MWTSSPADDAGIGPLALGLACLTCVCLACAPLRVSIAGEVQAEPSAKLWEGFARIVTQNCVRCHRGPEPKAGLDLTEREALIRGGDSGAAIVSGNSRQSFLIQRVREGSMPPINDGPQLPPDQVNQLQAWIDAGAPWPAGRELEDALKPPEVTASSAMEKEACSRRVVSRASRSRCRPLGPRFFRRRK